MANLNKENIITVDVKNATVTTSGSMSFYITDIKTCNIYCQLTKNEAKSTLVKNYAPIENAKDYSITLRLIKPNNEPKELEFVMLDETNAFFYVDLTDEYKDHAGTYKCELFVDCITKTEDKEGNVLKEELERITTSSFTYTVHKSIWSDLDGILNGGNPGQALIEKLATVVYVDDSIKAIPETDLLNDFAQVSYVNESINQYDNKIIKQDFASREYVNNMITGIRYDIEIANYATESHVNESISTLRTNIINILTNDYATKSEMNTAINEALGGINLSNYATHSYVSNLFNASIDSRLGDYATKEYVGDKINELRKSMLNYSNIEAYMADYLWINEYTTKDYVDGAVANIEIPEIEMPDLSGYATTEYVDGIISVIDKGDATGEITYDDFPDGQMPYKLNGTVYFTVDDKERQMVFRNEIAYVDKRKVGPMNLLRIWRTRIVNDATDGPDYLSISNGETSYYHFFATQSYVDKAIANKADKSYVDTSINSILGNIETLLGEI